MTTALIDLPRRALRSIGWRVTRLYGGTSFFPVGTTVFPQDMDAEFEPLFRRCTPFTMTSIEKMYALYKAVIYVVRANIAGDFVECGVWKGGSGMVIAETLKALNVGNRRIYLYDTFKGMPAPTGEDKTVYAKVSAHTLWLKTQRDTHNDWCFSPLEEVQRNMRSTGYPAEQIRFVEGRVEDTLPETKPDTIALLRLDTDWYESTRCEMQYLFPRLAPGGVLIVDDYGYWAGQRKAIDEYLQKHNITMLLDRVDSSGRVGLKR